MQPLDVIYLLPIYFQLKEKLAELGRKKWIDEEMSRLIEEASTKEDLSQYFQKVKGAWRLPSEKLSASAVNLRMARTGGKR